MKSGKNLTLFRKKINSGGRWVEPKHDRLGWLDVQSSQRLREIAKYNCDKIWGLSDVKQMKGKANKMFSKLTHLLLRYCYWGDVYITNFIKKWQRNYTPFTINRRCHSTVYKIIRVSTSHHFLDTSFKLWNNAIKLSKPLLFR